MNRSKWHSLFSSLATRLSQGSTHAGIAAILLLAGQTISGGTLDTILQTAAGIFALLAMVINDKPKTPPAPLNPPYIKKA